MCCTRISLFGASAHPPVFLLHSCLHHIRRRQQNVDIMLQNLDKTEALENKSADLANQAKTCAFAPPATPSVPMAFPRFSLTPTWNHLERLIPTQL